MVLESSHDIQICEWIEYVSTFRWLFSIIPFWFYVFGAGSPGIVNTERWCRQTAPLFRECKCCTAFAADLILERGVVCRRLPYSQYWVVLDKIEEGCKTVVCMCDTTLDKPLYFSVVLWPTTSCCSDSLIGPNIGTWCSPFQTVEWVLCTVQLLKVIEILHNRNSQHCNNWTVRLFSILNLGWRL